MEMCGFLIPGSTLSLEVYSEMLVSFIMPSIRDYRSSPGYSGVSSYLVLRANSGFSSAPPSEAQSAHRGFEAFPRLACGTPGGCVALT